MAKPIVIEDLNEGVIESSQIKFEFRAVLGSEVICYMNINTKNLQFSLRLQNMAVSTGDLNAYIDIKMLDSIPKGWIPKAHIPLGLFEIETPRNVYKAVLQKLLNPLCQVTFKKNQDGSTSVGVGIGEFWTCGDVKNSKLHPFLQ